MQNAYILEPKNAKNRHFSLKSGKNSQKYPVFGQKGAKLAFFGKKWGFLALNLLLSQKVAFFGIWVGKKFAKAMIRDRVNCIALRAIKQKTAYQTRAAVSNL